MTGKLHYILTAVALFLFISCSDSPSTKYETIPSFVHEKYLGESIYVTTEISGDYRDNAKIIFTNNDGDMGNVYLDNGTPEKFDISFTEGWQTINIYGIYMSQPTWFVPGSIYIECEYSDNSGNGLYFFNGLISAWTLP